MPLVRQLEGSDPEVDNELGGRFDHVLGTLVRLVGGH
jgi:hypothetical protein